MKTLFSREGLTKLKASLMDKKSRLLLGLGICGMLLIALSGLMPEKETVAPAVSEEQATATYARTLELQLEEFISGIQGAGKTQVLVTLENSGETSYLKAENADRTEGGEETVRSSLTQEYVLVDGENGRSAVTVSVAEPQIRGVAVLCQGGGDIQVQSRVMETVTTLLGISAARVSISQMAEGS